MHVVERGVYGETLCGERKVDTRDRTGKFGILRD